MGDKPRMRAALLVALAACADRGAEPPLAPVRTLATGPTQLPAQPAEPPPRPRVLAQGAEPRRELRYRPVVGSTRELAMHMKLDLLMMSGDHRMYGRNGDSHCRVKLTVASVRDGKIMLDVEVLELREPTYEPMRRGKHVDLTGLKGWVTLDDRGALLEASPSLQSAEAREYLYVLDYLHTLPAEPVGVGATWDMEQLAPRSGISMTNLQTVTLVSIDGDRITTTMKEQQVAPPQLVPAFESDGVSIFENSAIASGGTTDAVIGLDWPYPVRVENRFELGDDMFIHNPARSAQPVRLTMTASVVATLK